MVDSADAERMSIAKEELMSMMEEEELANAILLVFANKQDSPHALSDAAVSSALGLDSIRRRQWCARVLCRRSSLCVISVVSPASPLLSGRFSSRRPSKDKAFTKAWIGETDASSSTRARDLIVTRLRGSFSFSLCLSSLLFLSIFWRVAFVGGARLVSAINQRKSTAVKQ